MFEMNEILEVLLKLALPVAGLSFLMVWWALHKGVLSETDGIRALSKEIDAMRKKKNRDKNKNKEEKPPSISPVHGKWLKFGGGFYGIVALYTYGLIEWNDIAETIANLGGIADFFRSLGIGLVISMLIEGLLNFVAAISWPVYWMSEFGAERIWIWGGIAYGGYWLGIKSAQYITAKQS